MNSPRFISTLAACGVLGLGLAACGDEEGSGGSGSGGELSGQVAGAGASSQEAAQEAWIAGVITDNPDLTISYDPIGSGGGREQFIAGGTLYGGTDAAFQDTELEDAKERCEPGELTQIPTYISPIAIVYNLDGVEELQLSAETLAGIFKQEITAWNDPAIATDNPEIELPDTRITPVNRSDESGTTENFVDYLSKAAPDTWTFEVSGDWPVEGGEAAQGTSGVVDATKAGDGSIGYADASQAGDLGVATIEVGEEFVAPTPEAAAAIVDNSPQDNSGGKFVFAFDLDRGTGESGTYPIVLVSYEMACTTYDNASDAEIVKALFDYIISPDGQEAAAGNAGSAPISDSLRRKIQPAVDAIGG